MNKDIILKILNLLSNQTYYVSFLVWPVKKCSNQNQLWETTKLEIMAEKVKFSNVNLKAVSKTLPIQHCWEIIWEPIQTRDHFRAFIVIAISKPNFTWKIIQKDIQKLKVNKDNFCWNMISLFKWMYFLVFQWMNNWIRKDQIAPRERLEITTFY